MDMVKRLINNYARTTYGACVTCKCCKQLRGVYHFDESANSDSGLYPFCRQCVAKLETNHARNYERYFPNANGAAK